MRFSFLEVQDGVYANVGQVMNRMIELKGLSQDVLKNSSDNDNYNKEFRNLQVQLYDMSKLRFNGVSMFANYTTRNGSTEALFDDMNQLLDRDNTMSIFVSSDGTAGPRVSINKGLLLSALTVNSSTMKSDEWTQARGHTTAAARKANNLYTFASETYASAIKLEEMSVGVFTVHLKILQPLGLIMEALCPDLDMHPTMLLYKSVILSPQMVG